MTPSILALLAPLAVTVGALLLTLHVLRRWAGRATDQAAIPVSVMHRVAVGPRQAIALVRIGERVLVVSMVDQGIQLLTELEGDDRARAVAPVIPTVLTGPVARWRRLLRTAGLATCLVVGAGVSPAHPQQAATDNPATPQFQLQLGSDESQLELTGPVGIVVFMGAMTLIPALVLLMTSFTRILIVLHFLRSAIGTQTAPPGQLLVIIAVVLTGMVMMPVLERANGDALQPYLAGEISQAEAYRYAIAPFREFMLANTRDAELITFTDLSVTKEIETPEDIPLLTIASSFVTSELKTAFQMGFVIFLPFVVVDLVVAAVLMSMGMFMLPPVMVSLPFKLMLFVLADGWVLVVQNLANSFAV